MHIIISRFQYNEIVMYTALSCVVCPLMRHAAPRGSVRLTMTSTYYIPDVWKNLMMRSAYHFSIY